MFLGNVVTSNTKEPGESNFSVFSKFFSDFRDLTCGRSLFMSTGWMLRLCLGFILNVDFEVLLRI